MTGSRRHQWARRIAALDPEADHLEIYRILAYQEFPWDIQRALELALYRTFAVPSIGGLLDRTGEFAGRAQQRYDDTALLLDAVLEHGYDSPTGKAALSRINRIHGRFDISNDDMRYVLAGFVVVPARWVNRWGWRRLTSAELHAIAAYYRDVGRRMGIRDIPASYEAFVALSDAYEREHMAYSDGGRRTAEATRELVVSWLPFLPAPLVRRGATAVMDEQLLRAVGFSPPPRLLRGVVDQGLHARGRVVRLLPPRAAPRYGRTSRSIRSYPDGYRIEDLGPAGQVQTK